MANSQNNGQGKTLWEMLKDRLHTTNGAPSFYNPLDLRVGAMMLVTENRPTLAPYDFSVAAIHEVTRRLAGQDYRFTDYLLAGIHKTTFDTAHAPVLRLRAIPNQLGSQDLLVLRLCDEFAFDENFLAVLKDPSGTFDMAEDDGSSPESYARINDLTEPYQAAALIITGTTPDGKPQPDKVTSAKLEYWDYWRDALIGDGPATKKLFVFVEMNQDTGWFQIWQGDEFIFPAS